MVSEEYTNKYSVRPLTVHNTFSLERDLQEPSSASGPLRVYWLSQTLGPTRGLEVLVQAFGRAAIAGELHVRARLMPEYFDLLQRLQRDVAPALQLVPLVPAAPDEMVRLAQGYDAGWSGEELSFPNRAWCLGNKIFTYLAAGVPVILSGTPAQAALARDLGEGAFTFDDVDGLARLLRELAADPARRCRSRRAARAAAERRWHWEHPADRGALLAAVAAGTGR